MSVKRPLGLCLSTGSRRTLDEMTLCIDLLTRSDHAAGPKAAPRAPIDENVVLRRCAQYRDGFKGTAVSYPAALLRFTAVRDWIRRQRLAVDVITGPELAQAVVAGTEPGRIVLHSRDGVGELTREPARFEARRAHRNGQQILIDVNAEDVGSVASDVLAHKELDLVGLHCRLTPANVVGALTLSRAIGEMS